MVFKHVFEKALSPVAETKIELLPHDRILGVVGEDDAPFLMIEYSSEEGEGIRVVVVQMVLQYENIAIREGIEPKYLGYVNYLGDRLYAYIVDYPQDLEVA